MISLRSIQILCNTLSDYFISACFLQSAQSARSKITSIVYLRNRKFRKNK